MIDLFQKYNRFGVFGASESGKSTLAQKISMEFFVREKRFSIVLLRNNADKTGNGWGKHSRIYYDAVQFLEAVRSSGNCLVVVEDASATIGGDKEFTDLFTCIRHQGHKLLVIGHHASNLSPEMRDGIQRIFLFLQNEDAIRNYWSKIFPAHDLECTKRLEQYQFATLANYQPLLICKLKKS
jgi:hypothetical protein